MFFFLNHRRSITTVLRTYLGLKTYYKTIHSDYLQSILFQICMLNWIYPILISIYFFLVSFLYIYCSCKTFIEKLICSVIEINLLCYFVALNTYIVYVTFLEENMTINILMHFISKIFFNLRSILYNEKLEV